MSNQIYPTVRGLTWPVMVTSEMSTSVQIASTLSTVRSALINNPIWRATLVYEYLKDDPSDVLSAYTPWTDYRVLQDFLLSRLGKYDDFLVDMSMLGLNGEHYEIVAQQIPLISDGAASPTYYSPIQRQLGGFSEDITDLNTTVVPLSVWDNGTPKVLGTDCSLNGPGFAVPGAAWRAKYLKWITTPTGPITVTCNFYQRMQLESDQQDVEEFLQEVWTIGGEGSKNGSGMLKMMSSRLPL